MFASRNVASLLLFALIAAPALAEDKKAPPAPAAAAGKKQGIVLQISENDPAVWNLALNMAKNLQNEFGKDNAEIMIVAFGPGINMVKFETEVAPRLAEAEKAGVMVRACANTMKAQKLTEKDLDATVKVVPSGAGEIVKRQKDGWVYLRP